MIVLKTIKELRENLGLSQSKFAERFYLSVRTLQNWEQGYRETPEYVIKLIEKIIESEVMNMEYKKAYIGQDDIDELKDIQNKIIQIKSGREDINILHSNLDNLLILTEILLNGVKS